MRTKSPTGIKWQLVKLTGLLCVFFVGPLVAHAELDKESFTRKLKILPLGDSITQTWADASYRYPLWRRLLDDGIDPEFLGSLDDTEFLFAEDRPRRYLGRSYDGNHEGHWGWTADEVLYAMDGWLADYDVPDVALVHLGTNDVFRGQSDSQTVLEIRDILVKLRERNPDMIIIVAQIFPGLWGDVTPLNDQIGLLSNQGELIADCFSSININLDADDGAHPNASGGEKIAQAWWGVLKGQVKDWRQTYDRWESAYETSLPEELDSDADGWSNFQEYAALTDPLDPDDTPLNDLFSGNFTNPFDPLRMGQGTQMQTATSPAGPFLDVSEEDPGIEVTGESPVFFRWVTDSP
ncbi:MAG: GDSL-type esterase/lipase family protein [Puniceicoccaceae bacterium]